MARKRKIRSGLLQVVAGLGVAAWAMPSSSAQEHDHAVGRVEFPVSCSKQAQESFNRAVALLHHMTYPQARGAFEQIVAREPDCAMAHWGIAMTLFQPLWPTRPSPAALRRGWDEVQRAKSTKTASERERLFIATAEAFFAEPESSDYWLRIRRWEEAAKKAHVAMPEDEEAALFYALAHLATTPASSSSRVHADEAAAILQQVYKRQPDHPGAMHYLVHANDVPGRERELIEVTRKYDAAAPNNPHALHMPTHIYTRLGDWDAVVKGNLRAADAALQYPAGAKGEFVWDEFAHAIEYLVYAYLQEGDDTAAEKQLRRLRDTARLEPTFKTAFHLASTQARFALERRDWAEAAAIEPRTPAFLEWDKFMWAEAIAQFARGLGSAHLGKHEDVKAAEMRLTKLGAVARGVGEDLFARNIAILGLELGAWSAHREGQQARGVELMREAVSMELATPKHAVTPGPTLPALELLGDLYLEQGNAKAALEAYESSLKAYPRRFHSLLGAARAARVAGETATAHSYFQAFLDVAARGTRRESIEEAQRALK